MYWTADTGKGVYEANTLAELATQVALTLAHDGTGMVPNFGDIYATFNNDGGTAHVSQEGRVHFIIQCEDELEALHREYLDDQDYKRELIAEYNNSRL